MANVEQPFFQPVLTSLDTTPQYIRSYGMDINEVNVKVLRSEHLPLEIHAFHRTQLFQLKPIVNEQGTIIGIQDHMFYAQAFAALNRGQQRYYRLEYTVSHRNPLIAELLWIKEGVFVGNGTLRWDPNELSVDHIHDLAKRLSWIGYPSLVDIPATIESYVTGIVASGDQKGRPIHDAVPSGVFALAPANPLPLDPTELQLLLWEGQDIYHDALIDVLISNPKKTSILQNLQRRTLFDRRTTQHNDSILLLPFSELPARAMVEHVTEEINKFILTRRSRYSSPKEVIFHLHRIVDLVGRERTTQAKNPSAVSEYLQFLKASIPEIAPMLFVDHPDLDISFNELVSTCFQENIRLTGKF